MECLVSPNDEFYQMTRKVKKIECRNGLSVFGGKK